MYATGVRELKAKLSEFIRRARAGETVLVTDRGRVVAELGPPRKQTTPGVVFCSGNKASDLNGSS
jgi:antitoxin (DNA-binding transcriptional repressor) of toxin-antitoxin stability system